MKIQHIVCRKIFDSRGEETIEIELKTQKGVFRASVPSGKSKSKAEAVAFDYLKATKPVAYLNRRLTGKRFSSQEVLDSALLRLDPTARKTKLGGNVTLGISTAASRAFAAEKRLELWQALHKEFFPARRTAQFPLIFSNLINAGLHAPESDLDIQEYLAVMAGGGPMALRVRKLVRLYRVLGNTLRRMQKTRPLALGDEAGYAVRFRNNFTPILVLEHAIKRLRFASSCRIGIDAAASSFASGGAYRFDGKRISREKLAVIYQNWIKRVPLLCSFEDPFAELDAEGFRTLRLIAGNSWVIGDDLTATNPRMIIRASRLGLVNAVIIKPNQIGTITETCRAIQAARDENLRIIVSHRSGETEDNFIIHLAKACGADGVKIGAPARERMVKFNELIRIYDR
jgi:enolase